MSLGELARVGHGVQRDLADLDRLWHLSHPSGVGWVWRVKQVWRSPDARAVRAGYGFRDMGQRGDDAAVPAGLDEADGRLDLGAHRARGEVAGSGILAHLRAGVTTPRGWASAVPYPTMAWSTSVAMTRTSASRERARDGSGEVLSMTASTPRSLPVGVPDDRYAATAGGRHDIAGGEESPDCVGVDDFERLG